MKVYKSGQLLENIIRQDKNPPPGINKNILSYYQKAPDVIQI